MFWTIRKREKSLAFKGIRNLCSPARNLVATPARILLLLLLLLLVVVVVFTVTQKLKLKLLNVA